MSTKALAIPAILKILKDMEPQHGFTSTFAKRELGQKLGVQGFYQSGAYSTVIANRDPKKVTKITLSIDDGYHKYVNWVKYVRAKLGRKTAKHLPKIYTTVVYRGMRVTVLEKLERKHILYEHDYPTYDGAQKLVREAGMKKDVSDDLSSDNVLWRGKVPVIVDPWAHLGRNRTTTHNSEDYRDCHDSYNFRTTGVEVTQP
jgi:hypothetical protein